MSNYPMSIFWSRWRVGAYPLDLEQRERVVRRRTNGLDFIRLDSLDRWVYSLCILDTVHACSVAWSARIDSLMVAAKFLQHAVVDLH